MNTSASSSTKSHCWFV